VVAANVESATPTTLDPTDGERRRAWTLIAVTVASRGFCLLCIALASIHEHKALAAVLTRFDASYYRQIALHGYPATLPVVHGHVVSNPVGFFPVFPALVAALMQLGLPFVPAALLLNTVGAAVTVLLIDRVLRITVDRDDSARLTAMLWVVQPTAFVLTLAYSEAVFSALAAGCLLALLRHRWLLAGILGLLASATRPSGLILAVCCLVVAVREVMKDRNLTPLVAPLLAPFGVVAYFSYLWAHTGRTDAWFVTERQGWHVYFDGGIDNLHRVSKYVHQGRVDGLAVVLFVIVALALLVVLFVDRAHPLLLVYTTGLFLVAVVTRNDLSSVPRFLLPAFPLLLPIATRLRRVPTAVLVPLVSLLVVVMGGAGAFIATRAHYPP